MIKDVIERATTYFNISNNVKTGLKWLTENQLKNIPDGKYIISDDIYANVQTYRTKDDAPYEAHRQYIDIQYMADGEEYIGVTDYNKCCSVEQYDEIKDIEFLKNNGEVNKYKLNEGEFFILFPHDAHQPAIKTSENQIVKKIVVKVKV